VNSALHKSPSETTVPRSLSLAASVAAVASGAKSASAEASCVGWLSSSGLRIAADVCGGGSNPTASRSALAVEDSISIKGAPAALSAAWKSPA
jgi:hypothetical protein